MRPGTLVRLLARYHSKLVVLRNMSFSDYRTLSDEDFDARLPAFTNGTVFYPSECAIVVSTAIDEQEGEDVFLFTRDGVGWCRLDMLTTVQATT